MKESSPPRSLFETLHFGSYSVKDVDPVLAQATQSIFPPTPAEAAAERLVELVERKQVERDLDRVQSPFFPGLWFKKTGTLKRIERENARPWEDIADYLNRRYRLEQASVKELKHELDMTYMTIRKNLLRIGIPFLAISEYKNPYAKIVAASWRNRVLRQRRSQKLKKVWSERKDELVSALHTPEAEDTKRRKRVLFDSENPEVAQKRNAMGRKAVWDAQEVKIKEVLGDNPDSVLRELLVVRGLGFQAASAELDERVSPYTVSNWAKRFGIERPYRQGTYRSKLKDARFYIAHKDMWEKLSERQREVLALRVDEKGRLIKASEIAEIMGISRSAVGLLLGRAKIKLEKFLI